jgi:hypothetical protein
MRILKDPFEKGEIEMSLVLKAALQRLFFLPEIVTGASLDIDQDSGQSDPFEVRPVFPIKRLTTGSDEFLNPGTFEVTEG